MKQFPTKEGPRLNYEQEAIDLNGGLDFTSSKLKAVPGTLIDCQNFEVVDRQGYRRIDGFEPYDGRLSPAMDTYYRLTSDTYVGNIAVEFPTGSLLVIEGSENVFGIVTETAAIGGDTYFIYYARINRDFEPNVGQNVTVLDETDTFEVTIAAQAANEGFTVPLTAKAIVDEINDYSDALRTRITDLASTPIGLHWFRDRLYAVVDEAPLYFTSGGTVELMPNMTITGATSGATGRVLDIVLKSGTWAAGNANGTILIEKLNDIAFTTSENINVSSTPSTANIATLRVVAADDEEVRFAGLWQSRSEQQALDELNDVDEAGWNRIESGWEVDYVDGLSDSGAFTRIERGKENNFVYAAGDESGKSSTFLNGCKIPTDSPAGGGSGTRVSNGDPGWKDTANTAVYATTQDALDATDARFLYGDLQFAATSVISGGTLRISPYNDISAPDSVSPDPGLTDGGSTNSRVPLVFKNLSAIGAAIPDNSIVTGIEVELAFDSYLGYYGRLRNSFTPRNNIPTWITGKVLLSAYLGNHTADTNSFTPLGTKQTISQPVETTPGDYTFATGVPTAVTTPFTGYATLTGQTASIGGNGNIFGAGQLSKEDLLTNTNLSLALFVDGQQGSAYPEGNLANFGGADVEQVRMDVRTLLNRLRIKVYYTEPSARYYITDGSNVLSADLVYYDVLNGNLESGTAEGNMQFVNLQPVTGNKLTILKGDTIHVANPPNAGNEVATVDDNEGADTGDVGMVLNGLPSKAAIVEENSRYQFITANFFAREDWDGFYGVSGAGKAFSFSEFDSDGDGDPNQYIIKITSNELDEEGDKPRHIAFHHYALALGFNSGVVRFSVPGEPENFDGLQGAAEVGVGDKVTGLLPLPGVSLAVGCENSIQYITGSDADNYITQTRNAGEGVLEYTLVNVAGEGVFCTSSGISTLSQSEKYSGFQGSRLSAAITSWLSPRMVRSTNLFSLAAGAGVSCALPVRSKNQYRVFFRDGEGLTLTLNADGSISPTFFNYYIGQDSLTETDKYLVPFAWSSQVDDKGVERIHVSHFSPFSAVTSNYVYELEQGWGFAGKFIPAFYEVNWYYKDPFSRKTIRDVRIDGLSKGYGSSVFSVAKDYDPTYQQTKVPASLPQRQYNGLTSDFRPATTMIHAAGAGRNLSFRVEDVIPAGDTINNPIPQCVHQIMLLQYESGGLKDA